MTEAALVKGDDRPLTVREKWKAQVDQPLADVHLGLLQILSLEASAGIQRLLRFPPDKAIPILDEVLGCIHQLGEMAHAVGRKLRRRRDGMQGSGTYDLAATPIEWALAAPDDDLWRTVRAIHPDLPRFEAALQELLDRGAALQELLDRGDAEIPPFLEEALARDDLDPGVRDALLLGAEQADFADHDQRGRVAASLLRHARALHASTLAMSEEPLWAAVRSYATLVDEPEAHVGVLIEFMEPDDRRGTKQVALQSVARVFSAAPPPAPPALAALRARVSFLAATYLDVEWVALSDETSAVALEAYIAAAALAVADLDALTTRLLGIRRPLLLRQVRHDLGPMLHRWRATAGASAEVAALARAAERLADATHGPATA